MVKRDIRRIIAPNRTFPAPTILVLLWTAIGENQSSRPGQSLQHDLQRAADIAAYDGAVALQNSGA